MSNEFLACSIFFPRITLFCVWLFGSMPANDTPLVLDVIGAAFFPRLMIAYWIYTSHPTVNPFWIVVFVLVGLGELYQGHQRVRTQQARQEVK